MRSIAGLLIGAALLHAQQPGPQPKPVFRGGVELIQLDAVVLNQDGTPVRGLRKKDFTLIDRGEVLPIAELAEIAHDRPAEPLGPEGVPLDVASNQTAKSDRLIIVVLDDLHFRGRDDEAKVLARQVVDELGDGASMALVTTSGIIGVEVTEDRARLQIAVADFINKYSPNRPGSGPIGIGAVFSDLGTYRFIGNIGKMIGADDGRRKALVWITSGVWDAGLIGAAIGRQNAVNKQPTGTFDPCDGAEWSCSELAGMLNKLRASGVTVYGVSPGRPADGGAPIGPIAAETGGFAVSGANADGLRHILTDLDNYYLIGFYPRDPRDRSFHLTEVRVHRPGLIVRARSGYQAGRTPKPPRNRTELTRLAGPVMPTTDLPLRLHAVPFFTRGSELALHVTMEVDLGELPPADSAGAIGEMIEFAVFAVDLKKKKATRSIGRRVQLAWPIEDGKPTGVPRFLMQTVLSVPPGAYQLRASATAAKTNRKGSVYLFSDVPAIGDGIVSVSGLALSSAAAAAAAPRVVEVRSPQGLTLPFAPGLERVFAAGDTLDLFFQVSRKPAQTVDGVVALIDQAGAAHAVQPWSVAAAASEVRLQVPLGQLAAGPYRLIVRVSQNGPSVARETGIRIRKDL